MNQEEKLADALLIDKVFEVLEEMRKSEAFAYTEDSYSARIPGKMLRRWHNTLYTVMFRLRSLTED